MKAILAAVIAEFSKLGEAIFSEDVEWTITGFGLVARTFHGVKYLIDNAEQALFDRWDDAAATATKGVWADRDKVFAHLTSSTKTIDSLSYTNEYLHILTLTDRNVVAGVAWCNLHAYYDIVNRVKLPA